MRLPILKSLSCTLLSLQAGRVLASLDTRISGSNSLAHAVREVSQCQPFKSSFLPQDISQSLDTQFVAISPSGSYSTGDNGLELFLDKPRGTITTKNGVNSMVGDGATVNSTFTLLHGKVTFTFSGPVVPGVVTAAILISDQHDEIDVELLGGDPSHWQTNVYASSPEDEQPLWGVFGEIEYYTHGGTVEDTHAYTIDWNDERIVWSVDGTAVRTIKKDQTEKHGALHFPSHAMRLQLGIWDASSPAGTAQWAKGPIDWSSAPSRMTATFKSVEVECPY
ncbi:glycoside hydrolase family 16 protein [Laetiporus sulphureus 93-53]|uniref:Glycoside hydrolase family 16 protein n=1 Tax=Laetiporus sulphureus 93-53 TaxID=1314785 RepID=A0A165EMK5_9APHY|nr:glycoside hydrolase family 16 protein [Laetiporus sulphureus 93-53]KZT07376.1 glycoside hydrolase family 16 protein [Laetiporus sulphureus 93-53]